MAADIIKNDLNTSWPIPFSQSRCQLSMGENKVKILVHLIRLRGYFREELALLNTANDHAILDSPVPISTLELSNFG